MQIIQNQIEPEVGCIRLNVGCGNKILKGFINIDLPDNYSGKKPDIEADVRKLPLSDNYADELHAIHVIEHFYVWEIIDILSEWKRVLKPNGILILELPDLNKILLWFKIKSINSQMTFWGLYGDPNHKNPAMCHKWAYTFNMLEGLLSEIGFINIKEEIPQFHVKERDMRIIAFKQEKEIVYAE